MRNSSASAPTRGVSDVAWSRGDVAGGDRRPPARNGGREMQAERRPRRARRPAAERAGDAGLHARPARCGQGRPGGPPCLRRPRARAAPARAGGAAGGVRRGARPAERLPAPRLARALDPRGAVAVDRARRRARRGARRPRVSACSTCSGPASRAAAELGLASWRSSTGASPDLSALEARLDRDLERGATGRRAAPGRDRGSSPATATCAASGRRASSGSPCSRCSSPRPICSPSTRPSPPLLLLDDVLSELDPGRREILAARVGGAARR